MSGDTRRDAVRRSMSRKPMDDAGLAIFLAREMSRS